MSSSFLEPANQGMSGLLRALTTSSLDRTNEANRAVCEYLPCSIDAFLIPHVERKAQLYPVEISNCERKLSEHKFKLL